MISLIVNGDDLGMSPAINAGIFRAAGEGILRSASIMANGAAFLEACRYLPSAPNLAVGLHVTLTRGQPVLPAGEVASLVDQNGHFWNKWPFLLRGQLGLLRPEHIAAEVQAQYQRVRQMGISLTHVDSHHHVHLLPLAGRLVSELADRFRLAGPRSFAAVEDATSYKARWVLAQWQRWGKRLPPTWLAKPEIRFGGAELYWVRDQRRGLMEYLQHLSAGFHELMCHPAWSAGASNVALQRRHAECEALCDTTIRDVIERRSIRLISYREYKND